MKKNTVNALKQLPESGMIRFYNQCGKGKRIMFIGNSITLHGAKPDIGWNFEHGMAASSKEKDYVHVVMNKINAVSKDNAFCICQASNWEMTYKDGEATFGIRDDEVWFRFVVVDKEGYKSYSNAYFVDTIR